VGSEEDPVAELASRAQQPESLLARQHVRQALGLLDRIHGDTL
jgi:hypothetical protein